MGEPSESFTSLSDLINSHLSQPDVQASGSENHIDTLIRNSGINCAGLGGNSVSDTGLLQPPTKRFIIPSLNLQKRRSGSSDVLAKQIVNRFKALEISEQQRKAEQERKKQAEELKRRDEEDIIDLMKCLQTPFEPQAPRSPSPEISDENIPTWENFLEELSRPIIKVIEEVPPIPCLLDGSSDFKYISLKKRQKRKMSSMGRVMCARYVEQTGPYLGNKRVKTDIVRFDFSTPSPDDYIRENLKKPFQDQARNLSWHHHSLNRNY